MLFYVRKALIEESKTISFEEFMHRYAIDDVCALMGLPIAKPEIIYNHLRRTLVRNLADWGVLAVETSSKGNQSKYYNATENAYIKLQFYYQNQLWHDELVEVIASDLFQSKFDVPIVKQLPVLTNMGWGSYSKDFTNGATFVSFARLCKKIGLGNYDYPKEGRFEYVRDLVAKVTGVNITRYLLVMVLTDAIMLNEDRHLNNFGVLYNGGEFSMAPLFDYGLGLFECDEVYSNLSLLKALNKIKSKPFQSNHFKALQYLSKLGYGEMLSGYLDKVKLPSNLYAPNVLAQQYLKMSIDKVRENIYV